MTPMRESLNSSIDGFCEYPTRRSKKTRWRIAFGFPRQCVHPSGQGHQSRQDPVPDNEKHVKFEKKHQAVDESDDDPSPSPNNDGHSSGHYRSEASHASQEAYFTAMNAVGGSPRFC
ncbi:Chromatin structure-remodeling complex subunit SFH1 [Fusarium oxysporum f. sp. albedinis]|nr:Chromatin structure-remodeling complex subunit SFH1 [Fusarium oxysporum f. sp. albedinis]